MEEKSRGARQEGGPLQCPRCSSNNTKFCYYNNYNTAQPRHFCRDCHRYWTQGGALRNIPAPGESTSRKRNRRSSTGTSTPAAAGPSKVPRIHGDPETAPAASVIAGSAFAAIALSTPPPPPPQILFGDAPGLGMGGAGFPLRPTLSLFSQGLAGLRGFQPFNPLMMAPPLPAHLPLPLFHGLNMNQVLGLGANAGEGSSANSAADDNAGEGGNAYGNVSGGDHSFVNQFFTRFNDGHGEGEPGEVTKGVEFNAGADEASNQRGTGAGAATAARDAPASPANFI